MYRTLYREYRPEVFDDILGQEHIIKILKNQLATDSVSHAYLFCGTHGTGKTTTARILAKGLNCTADGERPCGKCANCIAIKNGSFIDVIEMDAASNNGVDNIRELRESVKYPPAAGRKKIYIIDEVHMLSTGAFNALLKTLEEPPENVIFILATTEPQKLPATILSRCMRLDFRRIPEKVLVKGMADICRDVGVEVSESALRLIAANADGSVRDGLSILDQCISSGKKRVDREDVLELLGIAGTEVFISMTELVTSGKTAEALLLLSEVLSEGKDVRQFMRDWLAHYRGLLISKFVEDPEDILNMSEENAERLRAQAEKLDLNEINDAIMEISRSSSEAKWSTQPRILAELCIVKMSEKSSGFRAPETLTKKKTKTRSETAASPSYDTAEKEEENAEEPVKSVTADTRPEGNVQQIDLEKLWHRIFADGEKDQASFNLIRTGTSLDRITEDEFFVTTASSLKYKYLNENKEKIEELMEKNTGVKRHMKCIKEGEKKKTAMSDSELKELAESTLGIKIDIE